MISSFGLQGLKIRGRPEYLYMYTSVRNRHSPRTNMGTYFRVKWRLLYYSPKIFRNTCGFEISLGCSPVLASWGIFSHVPRLDQSHTSRNIRWIIMFDTVLFQNKPGGLWIPMEWKDITPNLWRLSENAISAALFWCSRKWYGALLEPWLYIVITLLLQINTTS